MKREVVMQIADASGLGFIRHASDKDIEKFENFAALVASAEREACAKVCEEQYEYYGHDHVFAKAIRARGQA